MALIFTDLPTGSGSAPCAVLKICKYQRHPWVHWESSNMTYRSDHPYIKYNCAILFFGYIYVFLIFLCFKICFPIDIHCKRWNIFSDLPKITHIFWTLLRVDSTWWNTVLKTRDLNSGNSSQISLLQWWFQDFPKKGAPTTKVGVPTYYFGQFSSKSAWKSQKWTLRKGAHVPAFLWSTNVSCTISYVKLRQYWHQSF